MLDSDVVVNIDVNVIVSDELVHWTGMNLRTYLHFFTASFVWRFRFVDRRTLESTVSNRLDLGQEMLIHLLNLFDGWLNLNLN